jgi:hypothetical protein
VATHCGSVGMPLGEIPITIHDSEKLNLAIALKRWPDESERSWNKRQDKLKDLIHKIYKLAQQTSADQIHYHEPSYVHPEP